MIYISINEKDFLNDNDNDISNDTLEILSKMKRNAYTITTPVILARCK